jgi:hypothetical protein
MHGIAKREITGRCLGRYTTHLNKKQSHEFYNSPSFRKYIYKLHKYIHLDLSGDVTIKHYCHYPRVISVDLSNTQVIYIPDNMDGVIYLNLSKCPISDISNIQFIKSLIELDLSHCEYLVDASFAKHVSILNLAFCIRVLDFSMLGRVRNLNVSCTRINDCSSLGKTQRVSSNLAEEKVKTFSPGSLTIFPEGKLLSSILDFESEDSKLEGSLCNVSKLDMSGCQYIRDVSMLKCQYLNLSYCYNITDFSMLGDIPELILNYTNIKSLEGLGTVHHLSIIDCKSITDFSPVYNVDILNVSWCLQITDIRPFRNKVLIKEYCYNIKYDQTENSQATDPYIRALNSLIN